MVTRERGLGIDAGDDSVVALDRRRAEPARCLERPNDLPA